MAAYEHGLLRLHPGDYPGVLWLAERAHTEIADERSPPTTTSPQPTMRARIRAFMASFGLVFGAFDFAITPDNEWIMFECNPFGQYGWLENELGFPITQSLAELLARGEM